MAANNIALNIQYAQQNINHVTEFYMWILNHMELPKIISRLVNGSPKVVFAQFDRREMLSSGKLITEMFDNIGVSILESLFGKVKIYRRRKPYYSGNGVTSLSNNMYQIIIQFYPDQNTNDIFNVNM
jgi:hypothetical protein